MNQLLEGPSVQRTTLRDVYYVLFRHKNKILTFFFAVVVMVAVGTLLQPEIYQSEAKIMMRLGRESVTLDPTADVGTVMHVSQSREQQINSELEILKSRDLLEQVVLNIGAELILAQGDESELSAQGDFSSGSNASGTALAAGISAESGYSEEQERAIKLLSNNFSFESLQRSNILTIAFEAEDPVFARQVVSELISEFKKKHIEAWATPGSYEFFENQSTEAMAKLDNTEQELAQVRKVTGIAAIDEQQSVLIQRLNDLQQQITDNQSDLVATRSQVEQLQQKLDDLPVMIEGEKITGNQYMRTELYNMQLQEQELLSRYTEDNIKVQEIRRRIEKARELLNQDPQVTLQANQNFQTLQLQLMQEETRLASLQSRIQNLESARANARTELDSLNALEVDLRRLERIRDVQEDNFRKYVDNLEQARIDQELQKQQLSNISVVQAATLPVEPIKPRKLLNLVLGIFLGGFGSLGLAFLWEYFDHTIKTPEDMEELLGVKTLAVIPEREDIQLTLKE
ncbi:MAG: hypothetical protein GF372_10835 [Candidatus Marinimicrobia bacterium]|nr:hypothetical protein [Candidatus Neomarinimicrobiota bacterium]